MVRQTIEDRWPDRALVGHRDHPAAERRVDDEQRRRRRRVWRWARRRRLATEEDRHPPVRIDLAGHGDHPQYARGGIAHEPGGAAALRVDRSGDFEVLLVRE